MQKSSFIKKLKDHIPDEKVPQFIQQITLLANLRLEQAIREKLSEKELDEFAKIKGEKERNEYLEKKYKEKAGITLQKKLREIMDDIEANLEKILKELDENFS